MRKKFKILFNLFVLFFVIFYPIKSSASTFKCDLFVETLINNPDASYETQNSDTELNDFGFALQYDWDPKKKENNYRKDKNGNFIVGKMHSLELAPNLKSGNSIIKINDQKFIYDEEQKETLLKSDKVKVEFFDQKKGNFILELKRNKKYVIDALINIEDIIINSIDQKKDVFEVRFVYDYSQQYRKTAYEKLYNIADGTIIFDDNGAWNIDVCIFTEEEFKKSRIADPGFEMKLLNIASKDNDLFNIYYKLTPYAKKYLPDNPDTLYIQKKIEGTYSIKNNFNLRSFPFDKQRLSLKIVDGRYNLDDRNIFLSERTHWFLNQFVEKNEISGWNIKGYELNPFQYQSAFHKLDDFNDGLRLDILIERKHGYYIFKVIIPIILILMICWSVVWIHPRELESRLTITIVCLLSLIAYNFVIDAELPKLEYLTVLDWIILISYLYAAIPNFLTIASFNFIKTNEQLSMKLESYGKKYGPTSYVAIIIIIILLNANLNPENTSALISWMAGR